MIRKAFVMEVFPGQIGEYEKRHNPIWPELAEALAEHGVHNYSIFFDESTRLLFAYLEIEDAERFAAIAETEVCQRWWAHMKPLMKYNEDGTPWNRHLREVFHLD